LNTEFIKGMGKRDDEFIIILDIDKVFSSEEMALVQETGENEPLEVAEASEEAVEEAVA